ncbi:GNAT family N-acetyltransferase [Brumimicrobium glaciale]|uniref:GNAT family N-acetyltransferase n=1 Tax=Brumimicrobium glaciale TaxID=200475 RepID=A0A4V1WG02_9FLAO|nr:GNAT family N-acetyltransferase [Brumimicrobium glaciale]RYM34986.1 GNAT family N-acetyltransferase [Brumimicrobium glaciale]
MITYSTSSNKTDLQGILTLQKANLKKNLSQEEIEKNGFVTVDHTPEALTDLANIEAHAIAKDGDKVVGYVLAMTKSSRYELPIIFPMFDEFDKIIYKGKIVSDYDYMLVGQACIDKDYRGQGLIENCFRVYKEAFSGRYDFSITEIAKSNIRSLKAHKKVGFEEIHSYVDGDGVEWAVVVWEWRDN